MGDHVHLAAKAVLSTIPIVGSPAAEIFVAIITPPLREEETNGFKSLEEFMAFTTSPLALN